MYEVDADRMKEHSKALVELLLEHLQGRLWDGKEALLNALSIVCQKTHENLEEFVTTILEAFQNASMKGKKEFRYALYLE